jgi:hypothetical protein
MRKAMTFKVDGRQMTVRDIRKNPMNIHGINDGHIRGRLKSGDDTLAHLLRPVNTAKKEADHYFNVSLRLAEPAWAESVPENVIVSPTKEQPSMSPTREISDGSTAGYYQLPEGARELQDIISHKNMNAQIGEVFRTAYRYGGAAHSDMLRDAKKMKFYIDAEIKRLEKLA